ncbi:hypothetical protein R1flu_010429 [Riccia fluitans]|uniref:Uncharacterized protein n=1 Tax=Riccia fluitans TaxID=41844 RepID=A0ABD1Z951_9MARC
MARTAGQRKRTMIEHERHDNKQKRLSDFVISLSKAYFNTRENMAFFKYGKVCTLLRTAGVEMTSNLYQNDKAVVDKDASAISHQVTSFLNLWGLDCTRFVGFGSDGAMLIRPSRVM